MTPSYISVSSLPVETLRDIFLFVVRVAETENVASRLELHDSSRDERLSAHPSSQSLSISHVSRSWMTIARSYSRLWRNVQVENPALAVHSLQLSSTSSEHLEVEMRGSSRCFPETTSWNANEDFDYEIDTSFGDAIHMLLDNAPQIRSIHLFIVAQDFRWWKWVAQRITATKAEFSALEELASVMASESPWGSPIQLDLFFAHHCTCVLKHTHLNNSIFSASAFKRFVLKTLIIDISLVDLNACGVDWRDVLNSVGRSVEHLDMSAYLFSNPGDVLIYFPMLKQLHLRESVIRSAWLWKVMDAPMVSYVVIHKVQHELARLDLEVYRNLALCVNLRFRKATDLEIDHFALSFRHPGSHGVELVHCGDVFHLVLEFLPPDDRFLAFCQALDRRLLLRITSLHLHCFGIQNRKIFEQLVPLLPSVMNLDIDEFAATSLFQIWVSALDTSTHKNKMLVFPSLHAMRLTHSTLASFVPPTMELFKSLHKDMLTVATLLTSSEMPIWTLSVESDVPYAQELCEALSELVMHAKTNMTIIVL
jgi:hypothetical protein